MGKSIVLVNQKGGVGKTTSAVNLASYMAKIGKKVLLIDFDSQANLTSCLGIDKNSPGVYEVITGQKKAEEVIQKTRIDGLSLIPSSINLTGANIELVNESEREYYLKKSLGTVKAKWDYLFIDCPPSLGIITLNGLAAADYVFIPLQCEYFALEGLSQLMKTIKMVQKSFNPDIKMGGIIFTMFDARTRIAREVVQQVSGFFKGKIFRTVVPRNVRLAEAPSHGLSILEYAPESPGAVSYQKLAQEVVARV